MSKKSDNIFEKIAAATAKFTGSTPAFIIALIIVLSWAAAGPFFNYSEEWQIVINTGTTIITFLMVFTIQRVQNKDSLAIQLKLDELVNAMEGASNSLVSIEDVSEKELEKLRNHYRILAEYFEKNKIPVKSTDKKHYNNHKINRKKQNEKK